MSLSMSLKCFDVFGIKKNIRPDFLTKSLKIRPTEYVLFVLFFFYKLKGEQSVFRGKNCLGNGPHLF
jgi:hypothetical protein